MSESFGELIRRRREELGLDQIELAEMIGTNNSQISKWERGVRGVYPPRPDMMARLAAVLHISQDELLAAYGYEIHQDRPEPETPDARIFTSLVESVDWDEVPDVVKEVVRRDLELAREQARRRRQRS